MRVVETREEEGSIIRRVRKCKSCKHRSFSYERLEPSEIRVVKRNGLVVDFDRGKIMFSIRRASSKKRSIDEKVIREIVDRVVRDIRILSQSEVPTMKVGELVLKHLKEVDDVAYVRFASVFWDFKSIRDFKDRI